VNRERELEATSKAVGRIAADPITWAPFLPIAAAFAFLGAPWWICTGLGAGVAIVLTAWWKRQWPTLRGSAYLESIRSHLAKENAVLATRLDNALDAIGTRAIGADAAARLRNVAAHKTAIETAIIEDGHVSGDEREIAAMVGQLCGGLIGEVESLAALPPDAGGQAALAREILRGLETLERTRQEIHTLLNPAPDTRGQPGHPLREHANQLQERLDEARAIRTRLSRDLNPDPAETTTPPPREGIQQ